MSVFCYNEKSFLLDETEFQIISGSIHYFRTVPQYWRDRLRKLKQCGFNTVETYTCWNLHERRENEFSFEGILDLGQFLDIAKEEGLYAIVRPGPYICAEWEFGGLPSWLLKYENIHIRCRNPIFLEKEKRYLSKLFEIIVPRLITNGGNILMVQVENEYGSYGNDHDYINELADFYRQCGIDTVLFTSDGANEMFLGGGTVPDLLPTANFGSDFKTWFGELERLRPGFPKMCAEYWDGWFDTWHEPHHRRIPDDVPQQLDGIISSGGNVNFYMFCGGTNFGFHNGANIIDGKICPQTTSYDYDAMLTEEGDLTERYFRCREVIEKHFGTLPPLTVNNTKKMSYGKVLLKESSSVIKYAKNNVDPIVSAFPQSFEELGIDFGFVLYSTTIDYELPETEIIIEPVRDRAIIFINGIYAGTKERDRRDDRVTVSVKKGETVQVDVLMENMGRVNYGQYMLDNRKGITTGVRTGQQYLFGWKMYPMTMDDLSNVVFDREKGFTEPAFLKGEFAVDGTPCDTFVRLDGFKKGFVCVNGFNIGRYWNTAGPQKTLYLPAPLLKKGNNTVVVCELDGYEQAEICLTDVRDLG